MREVTRNDALVSIHGILFIQKLVMLSKCLACEIVFVVYTPLGITRDGSLSLLLAHQISGRTRERACVWKTLSYELCYVVIELEQLF